MTSLSRSWLRAFWLAALVGAGIALVYFSQFMAAPSSDRLDVTEMTDGNDEPNRIPLPVTIEPERKASSVTSPAPPTVRQPSPAPLAPASVLARWRSADFFAEYFDSEPIDSDWAPQIEAYIRDAIATNVDLNMINAQVHCRTTMCRVEVVFQYSTDSSPSDATGPVGAKMHEALRRLHDPELQLSFPPSLASAELAYTSSPPLGTPDGRGRGGARIWVGYAHNSFLLPSRVPQAIRDQIDALIAQQGDQLEAQDVPATEQGEPRRQLRNIEPVRQ